MVEPFRFELPLEIRGPRVLLRAALDDDADAYAEAVRESTDTLGRWMSWGHAGYSREEALAWFVLCREGRALGAANEYLVFDGDRFVGACGVNNVVAHHRHANLGYWTRKSATRASYASEATRTLARAAILEGGLHRIEIVADLRNVASQGVAIKAGATREAILRSRIFMHGEVLDAVGFSIVRSDVERAP